jgi:hypothetical protein
MDSHAFAFLGSKVDCVRQVLAQEVDLACLLIVISKWYIGVPWTCSSTVLASDSRNKGRPSR